MWIPRASASARGSGQLTVLALAAEQTPPPAQLPESEAAKQVVTLVGLQLAAKAVELMEQDEDDLFFENGQTRTEFLDALVSEGQFSGGGSAPCYWGGVLAPLLCRVCGGGSQSAAQVQSVRCAAVCVVLCRGLAAAPWASLGLSA